MPGTREGDGQGGADVRAGSTSSAALPMPWCAASAHPSGRSSFTLQAPTFWPLQHSALGLVVNFLLFKYFLVCSFCLLPFAALPGPAMFLSCERRASKVTEQSVMTRMLAPYGSGELCMCIKSRSDYIPSVFK